MVKPVFHDALEMPDIIVPEDLFSARHSVRTTN
jgi:hypothetical protein